MTRDKLKNEYCHPCNNRGWYIVERPCPMCEGKKIDDGRQCEKCKGKGRIDVQEDCVLCSPKPWWYPVREIYRSCIRVYGRIRRRIGFIVAGIYNRFVSSS